MSSQALLQRNPALTAERFCDHWYNKHAQLVTPFFLFCKVENYIQIHGPLTSTQTSTSDLKLEKWDGAAETQLSPLLLAAFAEPDSGKVPLWVMKYYQEIVVPDERTFLVSEAMKHVKRVEEGTVVGERKVIIENGKAVVDVGENVWEIWRGYERKGKDT